MVKEISNFLSKKDCNSIIKMIDQNNHRSTVAGGGDNKSIYEESRTSSTSNLNPQNPVIKRLHKRISKFLNLNPNQGEAIQGQVYEPGQFFRPHTDFFEGDSFTNHCLHSGNRIHTFMVYLNVPEEGGETSFPSINLDIKPQTGKAVSWPNMLGGKVLPEMIHEGTNVVKGKKYIITSWWRENEWNGAEDDKLSREYHDNLQTQLNLKTIDYQNKTFNSTLNIPRFTEHGFKVVKLPPKTWDLIREAYVLLQNNMREEVWEGKENIIGGEGNTSDLLDFSQLPTIRNIIHQQLQPFHEAFIENKAEIEPSFIYGIRSYNKGSTLTPHVDRIETHHISSIICVDKNLSCGCGPNKEPEDWALEIQDHQGNFHSIYTEPGDMILYESAACEHGRKLPFKGTFFRNFFVHYKLTDWKVI